MDKYKSVPTPVSALDEDMIEYLAEAQQAVAIPMEINTRIRADLMQKISEEAVTAHKNSAGFDTIRIDGGEWIEAMPGAQFKVLHDDGKGLDGLLSYLIKLEPGFEMHGHDHPFDEECLMLEGDLTLGDQTLYKGDFHFATAGVAHGHVSTQKGCMAFIRGALPT